MQLHGPARVLAILGAKDVDDARGKAGEAANVVAQTVPQGSDGIGGRLGGVVPAFQGRDAEANFLVSERMAPGFGGQGGECCLQFAGRRWCGKQRANDREAQARPSITLGWIDNRFQVGLPVGDAGGTATGSEGYKPSPRLAICILCG